MSRLTHESKYIPNKPAALGHVAVCCSVLQCMSGVLQCVAGCCKLLQCAAVCYSICHVSHLKTSTHTMNQQPSRTRCSVLQCMPGVLQCVAVCCNVLQSVAACCSALQYMSRLTRGNKCISSKQEALVLVAECCSVLQCMSGVLQCAVVGCSVLQCILGCCSVLQCVAV